MKTETNTTKLERLRNRLILLQQSEDICRGRWGVLARYVDSIDNAIDELVKGAETLISVTEKEIVMNKAADKENKRE